MTAIFASALEHQWLIIENSGGYWISNSLRAEQNVGLYQLNTEDHLPDSKEQNNNPLLIRLISHPSLLLVASLASILLWMPFGFGYYEFPWENRIARYLLQAFAIAFPLLAGTSCAISFKARSYRIRFIVAIISLLIGSYGCLQMISWTISYVWKL